MKKILLLVLVMIFLVPSYSFAQSSSNNVKIHYFTYDASKDQYILDYTLTGYANAVVTVFVTPSGTTYTKEWGSWTVNRRIFHFCNGTYNYDFKVNGQLVGWIDNLVTTQVQNPNCVQKIPGSDPTDVNPTIEDKNDGSKRIHFTTDDGTGNDGGGANKYTLEKSTNGGNTWSEINEKQRGNTNGQFTTDYFDVGYPGYYRIVSYDENNNVISTDYIGESEFENSAKCNGCKTLSEMLACPAWETYLSDFSEAISEAIPPPPDIIAGNDDLIEKLANQDVTPDEPDPPSPFDPFYQEQEIDLPEKIETDITPSPTDFEPVTEGEGEGAITLIDPGAWVPDDTDIGYDPPNPEPGEAKDYTYQDDPQTPPGYDYGDEPNPPDYEYNDTGGELPDYQHNDDGTIPDYEADDGGQGGVPNYNYN